MDYMYAGVIRSVNVELLRRQLQEIELRFYGTPRCGVSEIWGVPSWGPLLQGNPANWGSIVGVPYLRKPHICGASAGGRGHRFDDFTRLQPGGRGLLCLVRRVGGLSFFRRILGLKGGRKRCFRVNPSTG